MRFLQGKFHYIAPWSMARLQEPMEDMKITKAKQTVYINAGGWDAALKTKKITCPEPGGLFSKERSIASITQVTADTFMVTVRFYGTLKVVVVDGLEDKGVED